MKKRITNILVASLLLVSSTGGLLASEYQIKGVLYPEVGFSVNGDGVSYEVGAASLVLKLNRKFEVGMKFMGEGFYLRESGMSDPGWALKAGVYSLWRLRSEGSFIPGLHLALNRNFDGDFDPLSVKAGINMEMFNARRWALSLNTGYQWRDSFGSGTTGAGKRNIGSGGSFYMSFGLH
jgi:hypothetical protein